MPAGRPRHFEPSDVLDRAMTVFWKLGYEGTGLSELERATGLGRQSLYGAFGDKRALFSQVVEHYFERVLKPYIVEVLDAPGSPRANIERIFAQWLAVAAAPDFNGCLVGNGVSELALKDAELSHLLGKKLELLERAFTRALTRARRQGEVKKSLDPRATARALLALSQGLAIVARVRRDTGFTASVIDSARKLLDA